MSRHAAPCHSVSPCAGGGQLNWPRLRWPLHHLRCLLLPLSNPCTPLSTSCVENINMCMFRRSACDMCYLNTETTSYKRFWDHFYIVSLTNKILFITCLCIKKNIKANFFLINTIFDDFSGVGIPGVFMNIMTYQVFQDNNSL